MSSFKAGPSTPIQSNFIEIEAIHTPQAPRRASQAGDSPQNPFIIPDEEVAGDFPPVDVLFLEHTRQERLKRAHNTTRDDRIRV